MSVAGALRSKHAEEFRTNCPVGEGNWKSRYAFLNTLTSAIEETNEFPAGLAASLEPYINNITDAAICERTQLSNAACRLMGVLPKALGRDINLYNERFVPTLIRQCASTKTVAQKAASAAISNIILLSPFNSRVLWHVCQTFDEKYSAPKLYAPGWLKLIIENYYPALNPDRDYEVISRAISIGLEEADANVRTNSRAVFWEYNKINTAGAEEIMDKLNTHAKTALLNDPNNPDKAKPKSKKSEQDSTLAQIKKERMKQKAAERNRVASAKTISSIDFPMGQLELDDDQQDSYPQKTPIITAPTQEISSAMHKTASRPTSVHKKGTSHDGQVLPPTKKATAIDIGTARPKKTGSTDSLRTSQNKKPTSSAVAESSTARPLLSAPIRRPRIVATPINTSQSSSRPASRAGTTHTNITTADHVLRATVSHKELRPTALGSSTLSDPPKNTTKTSNKIPPRSELNTPVLVPDGKENTNIYDRIAAKRNAPDSPDRIILNVNRDVGPTQPAKEVRVVSDGLTSAQRISRQGLDAEIAAMATQMPYMVPYMEIQPDSRASQMYHAYPDLNHDGQLVLAQEALAKALQYLKTDALDFLGFRKLRKLVETYGVHLITEESQYDQLMSALLPRLGTFDELLEQPIHEVTHENHPRYIRQAVLTMTSILIRDYPHEWSYQYQGQALAAVMIARCAYSVNCTPHEGAPSVNSQSIVNHIGICTHNLIESCINPVEALDTVMSVLAIGENFLMLNAPHDSEIQKPGTWASFNPYSKENRIRLEQARANLYPRHPNNPLDFEVEDPKSLPMKLPLLMETGLRIVRALLCRAKLEEFPLGQDREDMLIEKARHLMTSYSVIIRKEVMEYSRVLFSVVESKERFWAHFKEESERNFLLYYLNDFLRT